MPSHPRKLTQINIQHLLEHIARQTLGQVHDVVFIDERHLQIHLSEFRLTIRPQVFIAETLRNLVVLIDAGHHQQLLEQLRRLRQGKELALMCTRGYQVVARAFGGRASQNRRLDINEAVVIQIPADAGTDFRAQH